MGNSGGKTTKHEEIDIGEEAVESKQDQGDVEKKLQFSTPLELDSERKNNVQPRSSVFQLFSSSSSVKTSQDGVSTVQTTTKTTIGEVQKSQRSPQVLYSKQEEKISVSSVRSRAPVGRISKRTPTKSPAKAISASRRNAKSSPKTLNNRGSSRSMSKSPGRALSNTRRSLEKSKTPTSNKAGTRSPKNQSPSKPLSLIKEIINKELSPRTVKKIETPKTKSVPTTPKQKPAASSAKANTSSKMQATETSITTTPRRGITSKFVINKTSKTSAVKPGGIKKTKKSRANLKKTSVTMKGTNKTKYNALLAQCKTCAVMLNAKEVELYLKKQEKRKVNSKKINFTFPNKNQTKQKTLPPRHVMLRKMKRGAGLKK